MEFYIYRYGAADIAVKVEGNTGIQPLLVSSLQVIETSFLVAAPLTAAEKQGLDEWMVTRGYFFYRQTQSAATFHASSKLVNLPLPIPTGASWVVLGGVTVNPSFFANNLANVLGRLTGSFKATGADVELRIVEIEESTGLETVIGTFTLADSLGAWKVQVFATTVAPKTGENTYRLEGRGNLTLDAEARFTTLVYLETPS